MTITGTPNEIAALVTAIQERRVEHISSTAFDEWLKTRKNQEQAMLLWNPYQPAKNG